MQDAHGSLTRSPDRDLLELHDLWAAIFVDADRANHVSHSL
jgi:hypothetical protein